MNSRIQQALDGELSVQELSHEEAAELRRVQAFLGGTLSSFPSTPPPDSWPEIRRRITAVPDRHPRAPGLLSRLWDPRCLSITWRPAYGLIAAAVLLGMATQLPADTQPGKILVVGMKGSATATPAERP